jgi:hypothetical protein
MLKSYAFWFFAVVIVVAVWLIVPASIDQSRYENSLDQAQAAMDTGDLPLAGEYIFEAKALGNGQRLDQAEQRWQVLSDSHENFTNGSTALDSGDFATAIVSLVLVSSDDSENYQPAQKLLEEAEKGLVDSTVREAKQLSQEGSGEEASRAIQSLPQRLVTKELRLLELEYRVQHVQELFEDQSYLKVIEMVSEASDKGFIVAAFEPYLADATDAYVKQEIAQNESLNVESEGTDLYAARAEMRDLQKLVGPNDLVDSEISRLSDLIQEVGESKRENPDPVKQNSNSSDSATSLDRACSAMKNADLAVVTAADNFYAGSVSGSDISKLKSAESRINSTYKSVNGGMYNYMVGQANAVYLLWSSLEFGDAGTAFFAIESYLDGDEYTRYCK